MNSSPFTETSTPADLSSRLAEIKAIDEQIKALEEQSKTLAKKRDCLEKLCVEDMTLGQIDGMKVAGRSWRIEWTHSMSATEASKDGVIEALTAMGVDPDTVTQINTARLKAILKEDAERRGIDIRQSWTAGTPLEGKAGEYVAPRLRFTTAG